MPAFLKPNMTIYIPIENNTIFQGAPLMTCLIFTAFDLRANIRNIKAMIPVKIDTGILVNSLIR